MIIIFQWTINSFVTFLILNQQIKLDNPHLVTINDSIINVIEIFDISD